METSSPQPSSQPSSKPLTPEAQNQSVPVWQLSTDPDTSKALIITIPESGVLNILYQAQALHGDTTVIIVQVWHSGSKETIEAGQPYQFSVEPGDVISLTYSQFDKINLQYSISPK